MLEKIKEQLRINGCPARGLGAAVPSHGSKTGPCLQGNYARVEGLTKKRVLCSFWCRWCTRWAMRGGVRGNKNGHDHRECQSSQMASILLVFSWSQSVLEKRPGSWVEQSPSQLCKSFTCPTAIVGSVSAQEHVKVDSWGSPARRATAVWGPGGSRWIPVGHVTVRPCFGHPGFDPPMHLAQNHPIST